MTVVVGRVALALVILAAPVSAEEAAEGRVELAFLESEISLEVGERVAVPLEVRGELQCDPLQDPPGGAVPIMGRSGIALHSGDGAYYVTEVEPSEVPFAHAGADRYVIDTTVELTAWAGLAVDAPVDHTVRYATPAIGADEGCTLSGWSVPAADASPVVVHLVPPDPPVPAVHTNEGPGLHVSAAALVGVLLYGAVRRLAS